MCAVAGELAALPGGPGEWRAPLAGPTMGDMVVAALVGAVPGEKTGAGDMVSAGDGLEAGSAEAE